MARFKYYIIDLTDFACVLGTNDDAVAHEWAISAIVIDSENGVSIEGNLCEPSEILEQSLYQL
jgi:hypothetical protein